MKPYLAKLLARTEAALFRLGFEADAPLEPSVEARDGLGDRVTINPGIVNPLKLREALEEQGLHPVFGGYPERPDTLVLWCTHHMTLPTKGLRA